MAVNILGTSGDNPLLAKSVATVQVGDLLDSAYEKRYQRLGGAQILSRLMLLLDKVSVSNIYGG